MVCRFFCIQKCLSSESDMNIIDGQLKDENLNKQAKKYYFNNINNPNVLSLSLKEAMEADETAKKLENIENVKVEKNIQNVDIDNNTTKNNAPNTTIQEEIMTICFKASASRDGLMKLKQFCLENNIKLERAE